MYINDTVFLSCAYTSAAQVASIALTAGNWYDFMIENVQGIGGENVNVSCKGTGQNYVSFTHSTNASGIQFAYDENENIPSRLGTTCHIVLVVY